MTTPPEIHPCLKCGACCAFYRVSFHWSESFSESHGVPAALSAQISPYINAMIGTDQPYPSCIAFEGIVGKTASCKIYDHRPNCCRLFKASFENGARNTSCEEARASKGLKPLTTTDWEASTSTQLKERPCGPDDEHPACKSTHPRGKSPEF